MAALKGRIPWLAVALIVAAIAFCTLNSFDSVIKGHTVTSARYRALFLGNVLVYSLSMLAFARGLRLLILGATHLPLARIRGLLLTLPFLGYSAHMLFLHNWLAKQVYMWVMLFHLALPDGRLP